MTPMQSGARFGKYELVERLGAGGMGEVWSARHQMLKRRAAVKLIRPDALGTDVGVAAAVSILKRFEREAQATSGLRSPHTIELYDFGLSDDGTFYYAMELLEGLSLHDLVSTHGPVSPARTAFILGQACESLAEAHHAGLVHRDIKPANIYLCRLGLQYDFVKVLDFGLVKREPTAEVEQTALTTKGIAPGSPAFMAPELAQSAETIDPRVDIYALGCVAYWLLTGGFVFERTSALDMVLAHVREVPDPPSSRTEVEIPVAFEQVVMACLAKDPKGRPTTAKDLRQRLHAGVPVPWDADQAEAWWLAHKPAVTTEAFDDRAPPDRGRPGPSGVVGALPAMEPARGSAPSTGGEGEAPERVRGNRVPIDTEMAMAPPEATDPMAIKRSEMRSILQHNFTRSLIDLDGLERRLGVIRAAVTEQELAVAVDDLEPLPTPRISPTPVPIVEPPGRRGLPARVRRSNRVISVFSGNVRKGRWAPDASLKVINVFGGSELDFREAIWEQPLTEVQCLCVFGSCAITVPPDIYVEVDGIGIFGAFEHSGSSLGEPGEGIPTLRLTGTAVFGGVEVKVKPRRKPDERGGLELMGEAIKKLVSGDG